MVVCHCKAVNDVSINEMVEGGRLTFEEVARRCGAGTDCGGCVEVIEELLESAARRLTAEPI